jgi:transcription elongation factor Elf1
MSDLVEVCPRCKSQDFKENHVSTLHNEFVRLCRECGLEFETPDLINEWKARSEPGATLARLLDELDELKERRKVKP